MKYNIQNTDTVGAIHESSCISPNIPTVGAIHESPNKTNETAKAGAIHESPLQTNDNITQRTIRESSQPFGRVWINETQYFDKVPAIAWEFYIGGYQPAQKWLKDRKERTLTYNDITHYQKIIAALIETARIMVEIDKVGVE